MHAFRKYFACLWKTFSWQPYSLDPPPPPLSFIFIQPIKGVFYLINTTSVGIWHAMGKYFIVRYLLLIHPYLHFRSRFNYFDPWLGHWPYNNGSCFYGFSAINVLTMEEIWSNRTYVALAQSSLLSTCVVFWSHRRRIVEYTTVMFSPERMYFFCT